MIEAVEADHISLRRLACLVALLERVGGLNLPNYSPIVGELHLEDMVSPPPGRRQRWIGITEFEKPVAAALVVWTPPETAVVSAGLVIESQRHEELFATMLSCARSFAGRRGAKR